MHVCVLYVHVCVCVCELFTAATHHCRLLIAYTGAKHSVLLNVLCTC